MQQVLFYSVGVQAVLTLSMQTPQNDQTHSNNSLVIFQKIVLVCLTIRIFRIINVYQCFFTLNMLFYEVDGDFNMKKHFVRYHLNS